MWISTARYNVKLSKIYITWSKYLFEISILDQFDGGVRVVLRDVRAEAALGVRRRQPDQRLQRARRHRLRLKRFNYRIKKNITMLLSVIFIKPSVFRHFYKIRTSYF